MNKETKKLLLLYEDLLETSTFNELENKLY